MSSDPQQEKADKEALEEIQRQLDGHGFKGKIPRVEYMNSTQSLFFYAKEGMAKFLCGSIQLEEFLEGNVHFLAEEEREIQKWYEVSLYRLFREAHKIECRLMDPSIDENERKTLKAEHETMKDEISEEGLKARWMNTYGYYFGETDPIRKELLYEIYRGIFS